MSQVTSTILMIRPVSFSFNDQTAGTNAFQRSDSRQQDAQDRALREFNAMVRLLRDQGVQVITIDDTHEPLTPDSIFPNNWISTHEEGLVVVYPMQAVNRRLERRADVIQLLSEQFELHDIIDLTAAEKEDKYLEGTGSMVLDRELGICYACLSPRTHKDLLTQFCNKLGFELIAFHAIDHKGLPVYHTNVVMCVASGFMVICLEAIPDESERNRIIQSTSGELIPITMEQMNQFAGNMLEVTSSSGEHLLVMSSTAYESLKPEQITRLEHYARIIHSPIPTIETYGGGSARCMMAEVFLPARIRNNP